jgi:hypothetical protein
LVKEMEDHKVSRSPHVLVRNRFTVFLCEEDWDRLYDRKDVLAQKLERHLAKHARAKRYQLQGDLSVDITCDPDLRLGHFGILADGVTPVPEPEEFAPQRAVVSLQRPGPAPILGDSLAEAGPGNVVAVRPRSVRRTMTEPETGATRAIPAAEAAEFGLAREIMVVRSGNRLREFSQGRVVIGRAADADFRIDNPDVSRRHAALSWSDGRIIIEDLGSTNGTLVNGHAVSSTVIAPGDVIVIGECRLSVQGR